MAMACRYSEYEGKKQKRPVRYPTDRRGSEIKVEGKKPLKCDRQTGLGCAVTGLTGLADTAS